MARAAQVSAATVAQDYTFLPEDQLPASSIAVETPADARAEARPRASLTSAGAAVSPLAAGFSHAVLRNNERPALTLAANPGRNETEARQLLARAQQRAAAIATNRTATQADAQRLIGGTTAQAATARFDGTTRTEAAGVVTNLTRLATMQTELAKKLTEMEAEMKPGFFGGLRGDNYYAARVRMMRDAEIRLDRGTELYTLLNGQGRYIEASFDQIMGAMERLAGSTSESVSGIAAAPEQAEAHFAELEARIGRLQASAAELGDDSSPFSLVQIGAVTVPALQRLVAQQRASAGRDPLGASRERTIAVVLEQAESLVTVMREAREKLTAEAPDAIRSLQGNGVTTAWVAGELTQIVGAANRIAEATVQGDVRPVIQQLRDKVNELSARMKSAVALNTERLGPATKAITDAEALVRTTRTTLGARLKVAPSAILAEQQFSPETSISRAREQLTAMQTALNTGDIAAATAARDASRAAVGQVTSLVEEANRSVATHADTIAAQRRRHADLTGVVENRQGVVQGIERNYTPAIAEPQRAELDQAAAALEEIPGRIDQAHQTYSRGGVVGASRQLQTTSGELDAIARRLDAIVEAQQALGASDASNAQALQSLMSEIASIQRLAGDNRTRDPARQQINAALRSATQLQAALQAPGRDPAALARAISDTVGYARAANGAIQADWAMYAQADRAIDRVQNVLMARAMFQRNRGFALEYVVWQSQIAGMRRNLAAGNYESVIQQAQITENLIIAAAIAVERAEREEQERIDAERRAREAEERRRRQEQEEAERRRRESSSGTGLPSSSPPRSGTGLEPSRSSTGLPSVAPSRSGTGLPTRSGSGTGL